ncbi:hypothetical protein P7K49_012077 [Saguinus oedipus]|uniref:Uncharacterized protein n=1 Tax=Saguinus oedipus TaxID=9490 RepID=A0ABQ9VT30_SAGOE|nr:hypothetical protein P7K49_012077 [Saguinus oedipus]
MHQYPLQESSPSQEGGNPSPNSQGCPDPRSCPLSRHFRRSLIERSRLGLGLCASPGSGRYTAPTAARGLLLHPPFGNPTAGWADAAGGTAERARDPRGEKPRDAHPGRVPAAPPALRSAITANLRPGGAKSNPFPSTPPLAFRGGDGDGRAPVSRCRRLLPVPAPRPRAGGARPPPEHHPFPGLGRNLCSRSQRPSRWGLPAPFCIQHSGEGGTRRPHAPHFTPAPQTAQVGEESKWRLGARLGGSASLKASPALLAFVCAARKRHCQAPV